MKTTKTTMININIHVPNEKRIQKHIIDPLIVRLFNKIDTM